MQAPNRTHRLITAVEIFVIVAVAVVPLFITFPFRVNIFLSWEGAYRIANGQIPFKDFGLPMGYMYWVVPALFFKIFGSYLITLIKAQVFINIVSGFAFRSILKSLNTIPQVRLFSVVVYSISFSFLNFWPWYNHSVIVYQFISLAFLLKYLLQNGKWPHLLASAFFIFCSFFTKQDAGALGLLINLAILVYCAIAAKRWQPLFSYIVFVSLTAALFVLPLLPYRFGYWFNYGQPPHTARFTGMDVLNELFGGSQWIKFYFALVLLCTVHMFSVGRALVLQKRNAVFLLLTLGILTEAALLQITSYTPPDGNIFFHSFFVAFFLSVLVEQGRFNVSRAPNLIALFLGLFLWWSNVFWKYFQRYAERYFPAEIAATASAENVVNRHTYVLRSPIPEIPVNEWSLSNMPSFQKIYLPVATIEGIERIKKLPEAVRPTARILNLTELTPLAKELSFDLERGSDVPLWHHLGVAMFNEQAERYERKIKIGEYDLVLFEHIPNLNNFFPFRVRNELRQHYQLIDSFPAPRRGDTPGIIEVYRR